jgi:hypothetical protein
MSPSSTGQLLKSNYSWLITLARDHPHDFLMAVCVPAGTGKLCNVTTEQAAGLSKNMKTFSVYSYLPENSWL